MRLIAAADGGGRRIGSGADCLAQLGNLPS